MSTAVVSSAGSGTICGRVEMKSWNASCSSTATAKLVSSMVAPLAPPHRPERHQLQQHRARHRHDRRRTAPPAPNGSPSDAREDQRIAGERHQRAMGEIDHAEDREDDGQAERQQRIGAAEAERVHGLLDEVGHGAAATVGAEIGARHLLGGAQRLAPRPLMVMAPLAST